MLQCGLQHHDWRKDPISLGRGHRLEKIKKIFFTRTVNHPDQNRKKLENARL